MNRYTLYHNPRCSKSRKALEILQSHGINPVIVEYLKTPMNLEQITQLRSYFDLKDFVRYNEPIFTELKLALAPSFRKVVAFSRTDLLYSKHNISLKK